MNNLTKVTIFSLALILCMLTSISSSSVLYENTALVEGSNQNEALVVERFPLSIPAYLPHDTIFINENSDFVDLGFSGYGNSTHPYIIEGLEIKAEEYESCISIYDVNASFIIANCSFSTAYGGDFTVGLMLSNVTSGVVENCIVQDMMMGTTCSNSFNVTFSNCNFTNIEMTALWVHNNTNPVISNCTFNGSLQGVMAFETNLTLVENVFTSNQIGLGLSYSNSCTIVDNEFVSGGISLGGLVIFHFLHNISDNTLDGKPIYYSHSQPGTTITGDYGQIIIANCSNAIIKDNLLNSSAAAIQVSFSNFTSIRNNNITYGLPGIGLSSSYNVTISSCNISLSGSNGISINYGHNATIVDCYINQGSTGIAVYSGNNVNISSNEIMNNKYGIEAAGENLTVSHNTLWLNTLNEMRLMGCNYSIISDNTITGALGSTVLIGGHDCTIISNTLSYASLDFDLSSELNLRHSFSGNTLNGKPIIYHYNSSGILYDGIPVGQVILGKTNSTVLQNLDIDTTSFPIIVAYCNDIAMKGINCSDIHQGIQIYASDLVNISDTYLKPANRLMSIVGANITLSNHIIVNDTEFVDFGIEINLDRSMNVLVHNVSMSGGSRGVKMLQCANSTVSKALLIDVSRGIDADECSNCSILDSTFIESSYPIYVSSYGEELGWNIIGNTIRDAYFGISVYDSFYSNVTHNNISDYICGIYVDGFANSTVSNNNMTYGSEFGLWAASAEYSNFTQNRILWNDEYGFYGGTYRCVLYDNTFGGNFINADDHGAENSWDDGISQGNIWSDYSGTGYYSVPGYAMGVDHYPSYIPDSTPPELSSPDDVAYDVLQENVYVTWEVRDIGIDSYRIMRNGSLQTENKVTSWSIQYNVGGLLPGVYNFTIVVNDTRANVARDSVMVSVIAADGFIMITNNTGFETYSFPGVGTQEDPYLIANRTIIGESTCIYITDTTAHFIIRNCTLISEESQTGSGILLNNVTNGRVEDCTIYMKDKGINAYETPFLILHNNTISACETGIYFEESPNATISENTLLDNIPSIYDSGYVLTGGIVAYNSDNCTIECNIGRENSAFGIMLFSSAYASVRNNTLEGCGFGNFGNVFPNMEDYYYITVEHNTVNGKPIAYLLNQTDLILDPDDYGQIYLIQCNRTLIEDGKMLDVSVGIFALSSENCIIENVTFGMNDYTGCLAYVTSNIAVRDSVFYDNREGLYIMLSDGEVYNSTFACNHFAGIEASTTLLDIQDCEIFGNLDYGIMIEGDDNHVYNNIIAWNYRANARSGDFIGALFDDGISIGNFWDDYSGSGYYYIQPAAVDNYPMLITDDTYPTMNDEENTTYIIDRNTTTLTWTPEDAWPGWYEIYVNGSPVRFGTWFASPIEFIPDFSEEGQYNVTVVVKDAAGNSISDTVFVTAFLADTTPPTIDNPEDVEYVEGTGGHHITWHVSDANPSNWTLLLNGTPNQTGNWSVGEITVSIDGLPMGVFNVTIIVFDTYGNSVSDSVMVIVTESHTITTTITTTTSNTTTSSTIPTGLPDTMTLVIMISMGLLIVVIVVVIRLRRGSSSTFTP